MPAYACEVTEANLGAIFSEAGSMFTRDFAKNWLAEHGAGYFIRDEGYALDCMFVIEDLFETLYVFDSPADEGHVFRHVLRL